METESKIILGVLSAICISIIGAMYFYTARVTAAFENGYEEQMPVGSQNTVWVKVKP